MTTELALLAEVVDGRWRPGIGDPSAAGWITVGAYFLAASACARAAGREPRPDGTRRGRPAAFWLALAALMAALGVNKQLDLQSLVTVIGRRVLRAHGRYEHRRVYQLAFIRAVALLGVGSLAVSLWAARHAIRRRGPALVGLMFVLAFVVIRAASFHHVDAFLAARLGGLEWNWILELGGIGVVGLAACRIARAAPPPARRGGDHRTYRYRVGPR